MNPTWERDGIQLYLGDCLEVLPHLPKVDAVVTDPPYLNSENVVPMNCPGGVADRKSESTKLANPWGYSLNWIEDCRSLLPSDWVVFCNFKMLGGLCTELPPAAVFTWRKSNAPRMTRPVPRFDCEFVVWSHNGPCGRMGEFDSLVIDCPMLQAGCFATERILKPDSGMAAHPCQKPNAVVFPFVDRVVGQSILDPFMGTGTAGIAAIKAGKSFVGIESDPSYFEIAVKRIERALSDERSSLFPVAKEVQADLFEGDRP